MFFCFRAAAMLFVLGQHLCFFKIIMQLDKIHPVFNFLSLFLG